MISTYMKDSVENGSVIRAMFEEAAKLRVTLGEDKVFDFSLGNPCLNPPQEILDSLSNLCKSDGIYGYMDNAGYISTRESLSKEYNKAFEADTLPKDFIMCVGAAGALNVVLKTLLNPEDEVIVFKPYFLEYRFYIENHGGKIVEAETDKDFLPDINSLDKMVTNKTKAVIINTPNNPTGVVYEKKVIMELSKKLLEISERTGNDIYLISDEPYREIIYTDEKHCSILNQYDNSFICYSYSKSASLPGARIGYVIASPKVSDKSMTMMALKTANRILGFVNAPGLFQKAIENSPATYSDLNFYKKNMKLVTDMLEELGYEFIRPQGAFYLFLKAIGDEKEFCERAKKYGILIVPSSAFGVSGYARLSYCVSSSVIENSKNSFSKLIASYKL